MKNVAAVLALCMGAYAFLVRPRLLRWGATDEEVHGSFPGEEIVAGGTRSGTMAVTIDAPASEVWPWIVQMGYRRGGWYSWDWLDNFGRPCADRIHPEWQNVRVGDCLAAPDASEFERAWEVAALEPERFLGLRAHPGKASDSLWGFWLKPLPNGATRLLVSGYWHMEPRWLQHVISFAFLDWAHFVMQMRQFRNLKKRVETGETGARERTPSLV